jgi:hypothetical protein
VRVDLNELQVAWQVALHAAVEHLMDVTEARRVRDEEDGELRVQVEARVRHALAVGAGGEGDAAVLELQREENLRGDCVVRREGACHEGRGWPYREP